MNPVTLGRVTAFLSRLKFDGVVRGVRPVRVERSELSSWVTFGVGLGDSFATLVVRLRDADDQEHWYRCVLVALEEAVGVDLAQSVVLGDGRHFAPAVAEA